MAKNLRTLISTAIGLAAVGMVSTAPQAAAEIGARVVIAGGGLSNGFGTGCAYEVVATGDTGAGMDFYDNGVWFAATPAAPEPKTHVATWIPATPGTHTIRVTQNGAAKDIVLTVGTGINAGSSCLVI
ncbi:MULTISPECIES: hypothetical protein [unclassified Nocardia]|uniref:hypothetical protein n=1 Tax=unclassified Nocardia TaxID=2637762 RepID=UPI0024A7C33F|nr:MULTISPECIES: hypothetical protein [unclassified Nocardia]